MTETEAKNGEAKAQDQDATNELEQKIRRQTEYYFGDSNLPRDRFIKEESNKNEGWFPIATLLKFNRIISLVNDDADKITKLATALRGSELIQLNEGEDKIRRNPEIPLPEGNQDKRTAYLKGFNKDVTLDELLEFFGKYEGMEAVIMRYYKEQTLDIPEDKEGVTEAAKIVWTRKFKGSVFLGFKTEEQCKSFLENDLEYKGTTLIKMSQVDYKVKKVEEYKERCESRKKKAKEDDDKITGGKHEPSNVQKGSLVRLKNIPKEMSTITRDSIKEKWIAATDPEKFEVAFVEYIRGCDEGVIRMSRENSAKEAFELFKDSKFTLGEDVIVDLELFTEEEEKKYFTTIQASRNKRKNFGGKRNFRGGKPKKHRRV